MLPELGDRPIGSIEYEEGLSLLKAIWEKIPPSAWKVQGGCKQIFDRAGLKGEKNIFQWTGNLDEDLPHPDEFHQRVKHPSLNWRLDHRYLPPPLGFRQGVFCFLLFSKHGRETRAIREERSAKMAELYEIEK
jgi:hypothetical protein